jgi:hypothetical protein
MIENVHEFLIGIVIGIRFRANFSIEDQLGYIIDRILYTKDSYFNPSMFPRVLGRVTEKILVNEKTENTLTINNSNILLEINLEHKGDLKYLDEIYTNFDTQIINGIMMHYKITQINRIGFVGRYLFDKPELPAKFLEKTIGKTLEGVNDINLRFSKKYPVDEALAKKDINDYHNVIFNVIKKADLNELFISIDFQRHFDPFLDSASQLGFQSFIETMQSYNYKEFPHWLDHNFGNSK